jgi:hypothetical protein
LKSCPLEIGEETNDLDRIVYGLAMIDLRCFVIYNMILLSSNSHDYLSRTFASINPKLEA